MPERGNPRRERISTRRAALILSLILLGFLMCAVMILCEYVLPDIDAMMSGCTLDYGAATSSGLYDLPHDTSQRAAVFALCGGALIGGGVLILMRRFSLQTLLLVVLVAGASGLLPTFAQDRYGPPGQIFIIFGKQLDEEQAETLRKRIEPKEALSYRPAGLRLPLTPAVAEGLTQMHLREGTGMEVAKTKSRLFFFPWLPWEYAGDRKDVTRYYLAYIEAVGNEVAATLGLQPINKDNRKHVGGRLEW